MPDDERSSVSAHSPQLRLVGLEQSSTGLTMAEPGARQLLEGVGVALYTTDAAGRITFFNEAAANFWGRRPDLGEEWCGSLRLYWPDGRPMGHDECPMAETLRQGRPIRGSAIAERPNGDRVA